MSVWQFVTLWLQPSRRLGPRDPSGKDARLGCHVLFQHVRSPPSPSSRGSSAPPHSLPLQWYHPHVWGCWRFSHLPWFLLLTHPAQHFSWCAQNIRVTADSPVDSFLRFDPISCSIQVLAVASCPSHGFLRRLYHKSRLNRAANHFKVL